MKESGKNLFLGSAIVAAAASSLCCILPVLAVALGLGGFGIASVFEMLRPYLLVFVVLALAFSFYQHTFAAKNAPKARRARQNRLDALIN